MIAVQKRSTKRHLVHPDGLATYCGRILHRHRWMLSNARTCDCRRCLSLVMAQASKGPA